MTSKINSGYSNSLSGSDRTRYVQIVSTMCENNDPYELMWSQTNDSEDLIPSVNLFHVLHYLVNTTRQYSMNQMLAYKSTEAHQFLTNGWVQTVRFFPVGQDRVLCVAKVKHSQSFSLPPLLPWCLVKMSGDVLTGWCSCVAGTSESCSHVGAVLFALEYGFTKREEKTCTSRSNSWLPPSLKDVPYMQVKDIDYTPSDSKRRRMIGEEEEIDNPRPINTALLDPLPSDTVEGFLNKLHATFSSSAIFRVVAKFADEYAPPTIDLPASLKDLFDPSSSNLSLEELRVKSLEIFGKLSLHIDQARSIEKKTRKQSHSSLWILLRIGLITASVMYDVCHTNPDDPGITVLKRICYPLMPHFKSFWMRRGLKLEPLARKLYLKRLKETHLDVRVSCCGLVRSMEGIWIAASPDGIIFCSCHGYGIVEIKCPKNPNEREDYVNPKHMYQIQTQLFCLGPKYQYCDYVVYHPVKLTIKRVYADPELQEAIVDKSKIYFRRSVLPELIGRFFSSQKQTSAPTVGGTVVCYCQKRERPPMVKCVGPNCTFTNFHASCVGVRRATANWLCAQCKQ